MTDLAVSVIVPTLDGRKLLERALPPLLAEVRLLDRWELIVADAGSLDGTPDFVRSRFPDAVVVDSGERLAFGANCNRAVAAARHPIVLLLNDDVQVAPGFLAPIAGAFTADEVFAVSPRILRPASGPARFVSEAVHRTFFSFGLFYHQRLDVDGLPAKDGGWPISFACGAAALYRKDRFLQLGGFDELFAPFYWEDFDLCYRAWKRGWRTMYVPASTVHHTHRGTIGRFYTPAQIDALHERNRFLFTWKNVTDPLLTAVHALFLPIKLAEARLQRRQDVGAGFRLAWRTRTAARGRRAAERAARATSDRILLREFSRMTGAMSLAAAARGKAR